MNADELHDYREHGAEGVELAEVKERIPEPGRGHLVRHYLNGETWNAIAASFLQVLLVQQEGVREHDHGQGAGLVLRLPAGVQRILLRKLLVQRGVRPD